MTKRTQRHRTEMRSRGNKGSLIRQDLAFNQQRALWAAKALAAFPPNKKGRLSREEALGDLLANLLHLARLSGLSPLRMVRRAVEHFVPEEERLQTTISDLLCGPNSAFCSTVKTMTNWEKTDASTPGWNASVCWMPDAELVPSWSCRHSFAPETNPKAASLNLLFDGASGSAVSSGYIVTLEQRIANIGRPTLKLRSRFRALVKYRWATLPFVMACLRTERQMITVSLPGNLVADVEDQLAEYIKRQRNNVNLVVPDGKLIQDEDCTEICLMVLKQMDQLVPKRQPQADEILGLKPGFVPQPEVMGQICELADARVRAIKAGASEHFLHLDSAPDGASSVDLEEPPVMDLQLTKYLRELRPFACRDLARV